MDDKFVLRVYRPNKTEFNSDTIHISKAALDALKEVRAATGLSLAIIASKAIKWALERVEIEEIYE